MDSRWFNIRQNIAKKRYSLRRLCVGSIFFLLMYAVTQWMKTPLCILYNAVGVPCLGCGLSRGMLEALSGDVVAATHYHVLSVPLLIGIILYYLLNGIDILFGTQLASKAEQQLLRKGMYPLYALLLLFSVLQKCL